VGLAVLAALTLPTAPTLPSVLNSPQISWLACSIAFSPQTFWQLDFLQLVFSLDVF
jgi:hypothetical protein